MGEKGVGLRAGKTAFDPRPCENSDVQLACRTSNLDFVDMGVDCMPTSSGKKALRKTILRILCPSAFSHSLDHIRSSAAAMPERATPMANEHIRCPPNIAPCPRRWIPPSLKTGAFQNLRRECYYLRTATDFAVIRQFDAK